VVQGDWAIYLVIAEGTFSAPFSFAPGAPAFPPTNKPVAIPTFVAARIDENGLFVEDWSETDTATILAALGVIQ
jgi:hypothetical protein